MPATANRRLVRQSRAVTAALVGVLSLLAGLALMQAVAGQHAADRLERSGDLVEAYLAINRGVIQQDGVEDAYADAPGPATRRRFDDAAAITRRGIERLLAEGGADDRALGRRMAEVGGRYRGAMLRLFEAFDAGDLDEAERIDDEEVDGISRQLAALGTDAGPRHATASLREIDALRRSQRQLLGLTGVSMTVGLLVLAILWRVLRALRRRLEQARLEQVAGLERVALTDSLTGIRNHRAFVEELARDGARARRDGAPLALVMLDLDGLKRVNDAHGHQAGDRLIRTIASILRETARDGDGVYRIGGDEFAAVLPDTTAWGAFEFAQRLHAALAPGEGRVSVGIAELAGRVSAEELVADADAALMTAKRSGRATLIHAPGMDLAAAASEVRHQSSLAAALARAVDAKDSWTRSHCETVAELCGLIAGGLGLASDRVEAVRLAGLVHDVGKIGVPDAILQKPARLDPEEYEVIKTHSALGHKILSGTELTLEAPWVLHHHERLDGGGYPAGLRGDEIPLESRIIHVADAFEAMTSDRPYRRGMVEADAIAELRRHAGTQFDPGCVEGLVAALGGGAAAQTPSSSASLSVSTS